LRSCSYGSLRSVFPILGMVFGTLVGVGTSLLCDDMCSHFYATETNRVIANGISVVLPTVFFMSSGFSVRKSQDYEFYHRIKEFYKDKLSS